MAKFDLIAEIERRILNDFEFNSNEWSMEDGRILLKADAMIMSNSQKSLTKSRTRSRASYRLFDEYFRCEYLYNLDWCKHGCNESGECNTDDCPEVGRKREIDNAG